MKDNKYLDIIKYLYNKYYIEGNGLSDASSYWKRKGLLSEEIINYNGNNLELTNEHFQLGSQKRKNFVNYLDYLICYPNISKLRKKYLVNKKLYTIARELMDERKILFGYDQMKQLLCFDKIYRTDLIPENEFVCVIGDGYGFITSLTKKLFPKNGIFCVNLSKMLLFDVHGCQQNFSKFEHQNCELIEDKKDLPKPNNNSIFFLESQNASLLNNMPVGLYINICSMQEMTMDIIQNYFKIMRNSSKNPLFYCCNRVDKKFKSGNHLIFDNYPWEKNDEIVFDEICPWIMFRPISKPPFKRKFNPHKHRLSRLYKD